MDCCNKKDFEKKFPLCKKYNPELFNEVCQHILIIGAVAEKANVPLEEMIEFFYRGKLKLDCLKEQEEALQDVRNGKTLL